MAYSNFYRLFPDGKKILAFRKRQPAGDAFEALLAEYVICLSTAVIRKKAIDDLGIKKGARAAVRTTRRFKGGEIRNIQYEVEKLEDGWKIQSEDWE